MKTGKRLLALVLAVLVCVGGLAGCRAEPDARPSGKLRVVATIFPVYDWLREIVGDDPRIELTLLLHDGVDMHSYQPTAQDILTIGTSHLFVYVGGESDQWVRDCLTSTPDPHREEVSLLEALGAGVKTEELVEGMEAEEEEEEPEADEHVWLSLRNAAVLTNVLADRLARLDPELAGEFQTNAQAYRDRLTDLDSRYQEAVDAAPRKVLLFGDRFPFRYLTDDYGLTYYAAFAGCSAETEASFETVIFLAGKADELGLTAICQIETSDGAIARTIRDATQTKDQEILTLDSLQSVTDQERNAGATYLGVMEQNLAVLTRALA